MAIIKNYGFLWERDSIYRGAGSNAGHLKGKSKPEKSKPGLKLTLKSKLACMLSMIQTDILFMSGKQVMGKTACLAA